MRRMGGWLAGVLLVFELSRSVEGRKEEQPHLKTSTGMCCSLETRPMKVKYL